MATQSSTTKQQPVKHLRIGFLNAAIWKNETKNGPMYNATFSRTYKDKDGNLQGSDSFRSQDLLALSKLVNLTHSAILKLRNDDRDRADENEDIPC